MMAKCEKEKDYNGRSQVTSTCHAVDGNNESRVRFCKRKQCSVCAQSIDRVQSSTSFMFVQSYADV